MYKCFKQMLRFKNTFDFDYKLTTNMSHYCLKICKLILTF